MLSQADNETLVRVGPDRPIGKLFRLYWIPFLPSADLAADGPVSRVKLLGEDLVAFRTTDGQVGLVSNVCAHRGAPMMFGRNEECGLRCVYHGWKYDVNGNVTDMPTEPARSKLKAHAKITAYPCRERNGMIWTYMGPKDSDLPPLPNVEWNLVPKENVVISVRVQECNWLQALEGEIDSAHAPVLHGRIDKKGLSSSWLATKDLSPTFECLRQSFGLSIAAKRTLDEGTEYFRVNQFLLPFYTLVPPQAQYPELSGHAWVPMDDTHTLCIMFSYHPSQPLPEKMRTIFEEGHKGRETGHASQHAYVKNDMTVPYARYWTKYNRSNAYQFDQESQDTTWFSGLPGLWVQDAACQCGVSPIFDRSKEMLASSDAGIVKARRMLLEAVNAYVERGIEPAGVSDPDSFMVRAVSLRVPRGTSWKEASRAPMQAKLGADFGYAL
jgi:phthalate 4,5-dioxygenase oxygenase subunit